MRFDGASGIGTSHTSETGKVEQPLIKKWLEDAENNMKKFTNSIFTANPMNSEGTQSTTFRADAGNNESTIA